VVRGANRAGRPRTWSRRWARPQARCPSPVNDPRRHSSRASPTWRAFTRAVYRTQRWLAEKTGRRRSRRPSRRSSPHGAGDPGARGRPLQRAGPPGPAIRSCAVRATVPEGDLARGRLHRAPRATTRTWCGHAVAAGDDGGRPGPPTERSGGRRRAP